MSFDPANVTPPGAKIKVIGVGGGGGNAVNTMIRSALDGVDFITANTDVQALRFSLAANKIQIGKELTRGLGAGADPDIGRDAALEDRHEIQELLAGSDMVFITAGMGGGTGTGGASVVAQIARELGALTVAVVTKPFGFEGKRRRKHAEVGIARLRECVDTLITIPNQRLLQVANPSLSMIDAFKMADEVLVNAVRGISDIINIPGMVNVDFADVKTVMSCMGQALMGVGASAGENRAVEAARMAISSPLLEDIDIEGATGILVNITAGADVTLMEVNEACSIIQEAAHEDANFIFGTVIDENLGGQLRVTVIATGFPVDKDMDGTEVPPLVKPAAASALVTPYTTRLTSPAPLTKGSTARADVRREHYAPLTSRRAAAEPGREAGAVGTAADGASGMPAGAASPAGRPTASGALGAGALGTTAAPSPHGLSGGPAIGPLAGAQLAPEPVFEPARSAAVAAPAPAPQEAPRPATVPASDGLARAAAQAREEAAELTRWTLDAADEGGFAGDDIPSLARSEAPPHAEAMGAAEPKAPPPEVRTTADTLFTEDEGVATPDNAVLLSEPEAQGAPVAEPAPAAEPAASLLQADAASAPRAGAMREAAPLEPFFDASQMGGLIGNDIDRKIDEALELAERMRHPRRAPEADDLDVPAFLRNGMKDLPLD